MVWQFFNRPRGSKYIDWAVFIYVGQQKFGKGSVLGGSGFWAMKILIGQFLNRFGQFFNMFGGK